MSAAMPEREPGGPAPQAPQLAPSPPSRALLPQRVLALQRSAGNAAVSRLAAAGGLGRPLQRQPQAGAPPAPDPRVEQLAHDQAVTAKRVAALELDDRWAHRFGERIASFEQVIHRSASALDDATAGFTGAHQAQAQADAMAIQVIGLLATVGFAAGFEWAFTAALGRAGVEADKIAAVIETVENPANAAASGTVNVTGTATANADAQRGQPPAGATSAVGLLASNLEALAAKRQRVEQAFVTRRTELDALTPEGWMALDVNAQNATYQARFDELQKQFSGIEKMKPQAQVAAVMERHMWGRWIMAQDDAARAATQAANDAGTASGSGPLDLDPNNPNRAPEYSLGGYVEDRLNTLGIAALAGVQLSGHAYWPNSPHDWVRKLFSWCQGYRESVG